MSDPTTSGDTPAAPAAAPSATNGAFTGASQPMGAFGSSRGTGLLRGKRPSTPASKSAPASPAGFQPSSIEVIQAKSEYKNPFTGETSVASPVSPEPVRAEPPAPVLPVPVVPAAPPTVPVAVSAPVARPVQAAASAPAGEMFPFTPSGAPAAKPAPANASIEKPRLNILPPAEAKRPAQSWESPSAGRESDASAPPSSRQDRSVDRPVFRPERREAVRSENDEPRTFDSHPPEPRRNAAKIDGSTPAVPVAVQATGFFGWLKSLFGGGKPEVKSSSRSGSSSHSGDAGRHEHRSDDGGRRRRHRGGRGRHGGGSGGERPPYGEGNPRPAGGGEASGPDVPRSGEPRQDGGRRRRGGRRHHRGDGGGYPRQEEGHRHSGGGSGLTPPPSS